MARPPKEGLDYFSFDVDIFEDDKLFDLQNEYGPLGEVIYFRLLCLVYKNGYYYKFESIDKLSRMLIKSIGNRWVRDKNVVSEVIPFLAECNLFSPELMRENVLTSQGIQRRFLKATGRRQRDTSKYWLLEKNDDSSGLITAPKNQIIAYNNSINVCNNSKNVNDNFPKVKESKVNESKAVSNADAAFAAYCEKIEKSYFSLTGRKLGNSDVGSIRDLYTKGCKAELIIRVIEDISGRKRGGKINSFNYFLSAINDEFEFDSNTADGRYPATYDTQDIENILDAEWMSEGVGSDNDYDYDD